MDPSASTEVATPGSSPRQWPLGLVSLGDMLFAQVPPFVPGSQPRERASLAGPPKACQRSDPDHGHDQVFVRLSHQLRAAEGRIAELEAEVEAYRQQADRAEQWLHKVYTEIEDRFLDRDKNARRRA